jgi:hypothetical protein
MSSVSPIEASRLEASLDEIHAEGQGEHISRQALAKFYRQHDPTKVVDIDSILIAFEGNPSGLINGLREKYHVKGADAWLLDAARNGNVQHLKAALDKGAHVEVFEKDGDTALHHAAKGGFLEVTNLLLEKGANVEARDKDGKVPLHKAAFSGHKEIAELLISKGASAAAVSDDGITPLHNAAFAGHQAVVKLLLAKGGNLQAVSTDGNTVLHAAAWGGLANAVRVVLADGVSADAENSDGKSPLDVSWSMDPSSEATQVLLRASKRGIADIIERHLYDRQDSQVGKLVEACDAGNQADREWLGTMKRSESGQEEDGLWVHGGEAAVGLLVRMLREGRDPALIIPLFDKMLIPDAALDAVKLAASGPLGGGLAVVNKATNLLVFSAAQWPSTGCQHYLDTQRKQNLQRYWKLNQHDPKAVPVRYCVCAFKGILANEQLLRAISNYNVSTKLFLTDTVRSLDQELWRKWGKMEFALRLIEYVIYTAVVLCFCWRAAEDPKPMVFASGVCESKGCRLSKWYGWAVLVWSARYLVEQCADLTHHCTEAHHEFHKKRAHLPGPRMPYQDSVLGPSKANRRRKSHSLAATTKRGIGSRILRSVEVALATGSKLDNYMHLGAVAHSLAVVVVVTVWTERMEHFNLASSVLVLLLAVLLLGYLRGFRRISTNVDMVSHVFWDLRFFFMLFGLAHLAFAISFHQLLPHTEAFSTMGEAIFTVWSTALLTHEQEAYPTQNSRFVQGLFLLLTAVVLLNTIISILSETYDRLKETELARGTKQRLQLMAQMRRSPFQLHKAWNRVCGWGLALTKCKWPSSSRVRQREKSELTEDEGYMVVLKSLGTSEFTEEVWTGKMGRTRRALDKKHNEGAAQLKVLEEQNHAVMKHVKEMEVRMERRIELMELRMQAQLQAIVEAVHRPSSK